MDATSNTSSFWEMLPDNCPPADAVEMVDSLMIRLVPGDTVEDSHFESSAKSPKKKPSKCDDCRWMSCSVWSADTPIENIAGIAALPKNRHLTHVAYVRLGAQSGRLKLHEKSDNHFSFWPYKNFFSDIQVEKVVSI